MDEIEAMCRGFLQNAAARHWAVSRTAPVAPTADYLTGFGDGWEAGQVAGLALALGVIIGASPTGLVENAYSAAAVDTAFPFDLFVEPAYSEAA